MNSVNIAIGLLVVVAVIGIVIIFLLLHPGMNLQQHTSSTQGTSSISTVSTVAAQKQNYTSTILPAQNYTTQTPNSITAISNNLNPNPILAPWHGNVTTSTQGNYLVVKSNGVPTIAGSFPNQNNPNKIEKQNYTFLIPLHPQMGSHTTNTPIGGPIGIALNGVPFFGPYTATGQIAPIVEVFDQCNGHPDMQGMYHYHEYSPCIVNATPTNQHSPLLGYAFDGYPIYGPLGANGIVITANQLDSCNGHYDPSVGSYVYVTTNFFPYILGCYSGVPIMSDINNPNAQMQMNMNNSKMPYPGPT